MFTLKAKSKGVLAKVNQQSAIVWEATTPKGHECQLYTMRTYGPMEVSLDVAFQVLARVAAGELVELTPTLTVVLVDKVPCRIWMGRLADQAPVALLVSAAAAPPAAQAEFDEAVRKGELASIPARMIPPAAHPLPDE